MSLIDITNIVSVSVAAPQSGLAEYQINNLLILTTETPVTAVSSYSVHTNPRTITAEWGSGSEAYALANAILSQSPNPLGPGGKILLAPTTSGETLADAITRLSGLVYFGGIVLAGTAWTNAQILAASAVVEPLRRLLFVGTATASDLDAGGLAPSVVSATYTQTRVLPYLGSNLLAARKYAAAYASSLLGVDFDASNSTKTMHAKSLIGIAADSAMTQTLVTKALAAGCDVYVQMGPTSDNTVSKILSSGVNTFADRVFNLNWFAGALEIAGFNALATSSTKLPQTEGGVAVLRDAYINVLKQAVTNGYVAPGSWTSTELFGDVDSLRENIQQHGYYVYSAPVADQAQTDREARKAPVIQIAIKEAGAIHSTSVIVNVNA